MTGKKLSNDDMIAWIRSVTNALIADIEAGHVVPTTGGITGGTTVMVHNGAVIAVPDGTRTLHLSWYDPRCDARQEAVEEEFGAYQENDNG